MGIISDSRRNFPHYLQARFLFVGVILGLALLFLAESSKERWPLVALLLANLLLVGAASFFFKFRGATGLLRWVTLSLGVALDTAVISYTGGAVSEFVFLYFFSIAAASLFLGLWGSVWIAALSEMGYACVLLQWQPHFPEGIAFPLFLYGIYFALTAVLTGYLAERLQERNRALEQARRELSQTRLDTETILKSLGTGLLAVTRTGEILYFNRAGRQVLGMAGDETWSEEEESDAAVMVQDFLHAVEATEREGSSSEIEIPLPDGARRPVGFSVFPLRGEAGGERGRVILFRDLTKQKEEERVRWRQERLAAIGELAKDLAHEIRNPLATISGCVEMLIGQNAETKDTKRLGELALQQSRRLNHLLRDFSAFARLGPPRKRPLNLCEFLQRRGGDAMTLDIRLPCELTLLVDESQFGMIVDAALAALSSWAEEGDVVEVGLRGSSSERARIYFRLPGRVVSEEIQDSIFQPFGEYGQRHLGLALPTALRAAEGHGGQLTFFSRPGEGTCFELVLESVKPVSRQKEAMIHGN
ncbi:MAG: PAS domain S-box protein [Calditrichaeota bacterium]|nr:PAS domain S-box protein [Calditrichota bacterium]